MSFTPKPLVEKLPLAVRKDVRDKFDGNKADFEEQISKLLGISKFTLAYNPNLLAAYVKDLDRTSLGNMMNEYSKGFIYLLKHFIDSYGEDGKAHFNAAVSKAELTVNVNEVGDSAPTIAGDVQDGVFRLLFHPARVGYDITSQEEVILPAIEAAATGGFALEVKNSIKKFYSPGIDAVRTEIEELTGISGVILDPNFEENYEALSSLPKAKWHFNFGKVHFEYFDGLKSQLLKQGFKKDEMLQEGLQEALPSKTFKIRVVEQTTNDKTNQIVIENGVAYLQASQMRCSLRMNLTACV
ncbi:unnamed protein product [Mycena citricolor]|uniref:Uncharacterized protein n=1 Tax=Mycena citricolor TaxID=2018698 RepID=A0AAD2H440_9AGAR|nr:unnamed protein product [Mycena citricolor]